MEKVTIDTILSFFKESVENKNPISPHVWVDGAMKLNVLMADEISKLYELQQAVALRKMGFIENAGYTVAKAKAKVESLDEYKELKKQEAKIENITEMIRLAKLQARVSSDEIKNY